MCAGEAVRVHANRGRVHCTKRAHVLRVRISKQGAARARLLSRCKSVHLCADANFSMCAVGSRITRLRNLLAVTYQPYVG